MSIAEVQFLNKILTDKDYSIVADNYVNEENFSQSKDEFLFLQDFYNKYKAVPDKETFSSKFPEFEYFTVSQPVKSVVDELREQTTFRKAVKLINSSSDIFEQDANKGVEYLLEHINELQLTYEFQCTDIMHDRSRYDSWKKRQEHPSGVYIDIPLKEVNDSLYGFQRGEELFLWLAKSGIGKTQILSMCIESASKNGYRVGVISPELSKERLGYRIDSSRTHMSNMAMQKGLLLPQYEEYFNKIMESDEHIFVADSSDFSDGIVTVRECHNFVKSKKLDALFIDGIVYVKPDGWTPRMIASEAMGLAGRQLLQLSKDLLIPVVGVVQAKRRNSEKRSENEEISDSESIFGSYELAQATTRIVSINRIASALKLVNVKNRYGKEGESWIYNYDFDKMLLTYVPSLEKIDNNEVSETKEKFKHVF